MTAESINGTIARPDMGIHAVLPSLRVQLEFTALKHKIKPPGAHAFVHLGKLKTEIVTMGVPDIDPNRIVSTYVNPCDWNPLISDPETSASSRARSIQRPRPSSSFPLE